MGRGRKRLVAAALAICALAAVAVAGCSDEVEHDVVEGEPLELGDLHFNVQLTRFLNRDDREDSEYLEGEPPPPSGQSYLGVFMEVDNESGDPVELPSEDEMQVVDTTGDAYAPVPSETVFAFPFGLEVPGDEEVPLPDTAAASGPIQGSLIIFLVDEGVAENRPLELEIESQGEDGTIELDI